MDKNALIAAYAEAGQTQVFENFDDLSEAERQQLLEQAASIDLAEVAELVATHVKGSGEAGLDFGKLEPAPYVALPENGGDAAQWAAAKAEGEAALRAGKVAAFVVAGGQGTRLGYDGPKGTYPVTPITKKPLFQVFAEKIRGAEQVYGRQIPWFIMTSQINHEATVEAFADHGHFGLDPEQVMFFTQGLMPAVDFSGKIIMEAPGRIAMSPDGHGGSLRALVRSGATAKMRALGIDTLSYFQVDNPLVQCIDPAFIGFHRLAKAEMSSKALPKAYPAEKLGHFCRYEGDLIVVEYSDMPEELAERRDPDGELTFRGGSIAIHVLDVDFIDRLGGEGGDQLPFHKATKKVPFYDSRSGETVKPEEPNGCKFEMFVFDALPFAKASATIETSRAEEFSPVKNAEGVDSPKTSREDQLRQHARWVKAAGVELTTDETGLPGIRFEISPLFATSKEAFVEAWQRIPETHRPTIAEGTVIE
ncbi:MAG: UTP--glucose-1-phosphate uridylyltransferase [Verrucomicrobiota bacterium]